MTCEIINGKIRSNLEDFILPFKITFHNKLNIDKFKDLMIKDHSFHKTIRITNVEEWRTVTALLELFIKHEIPFMTFDDSGKFIMNKNEKYNFNAPLSWGFVDNMFYGHITDKEVSLYNQVDWSQYV